MEKIPTELHTSHLCRKWERVSVSHVTKNAAYLRWNCAHFPAKDKVQGDVILAFWGISMDYGPI